MVATSNKKRKIEMAEEPRLRLGRGLAALIGEAKEDAAAPDKNRAQRRVPIEFLRPNPRNPRKSFDEARLVELADSIREKGILQPIVVREIASLPGAFEIIAGERRWRAAQRAAQHNVPIVVIEATDKEALELAIVENVQRSDLNALEEAEGYGQLIRDFGYSQADLGRIIGKSRSHVANTLRLLHLPENVKKLLADGSLSAGHARALVTHDNAEMLANRIVKDNLSVRDIERLVQERQGDSVRADPANTRQITTKAADTLALERSLQEAIGLAVVIAHKKNRGEVRIQYKSLEQLDKVCRALLQSDVTLAR